MADREKVINGLEYCKHTDGVECPNCPYWHEDDCVEMLHADALALLKEQPQIVRCKDCKYREYIYSTKSYQCPKVKKTVDEGWFCADGKRKEGVNE